MSSETTVSELERLLKSLEQQQARLFAIDTVRRLADNANLEHLAAPYIAAAEAHLKGELGNVELARLYATVPHKQSAYNPNEVEFYLLLCCQYMLVNAIEYFAGFVSHYAIDAQMPLDGGDAAQIAETVDRELGQQIKYLRDLAAKEG